MPEHSTHTIQFEDLTGFAKKYSKSLKEGDVVGLTGVIGAGKTTFLRILLEEMGMEVDSGYSSPTFTILNQYDLADWYVNHVDLYRLETFDALEQIDIIKYFDKEKTITFIEWADKFKEMKDLLTKKLHFEYVEGQPLNRKITHYEYR